MQKTWTPDEFAAYLDAQRRRYLSPQNRQLIPLDQPDWLETIGVLLLLSFLGGLSIWGLIVQFRYGTS